MARTTFGEELRKKREERGWSQAHLSDRIYGDSGKNRTQIARWEKPKKRKGQIEEPNLKALIEAFDLSYPEAMYWYGLAGKLPTIKMPSKRQIYQSFETLIPALQQHPYPAYVSDTRYFKSCLINAATIRLAGGMERIYQIANLSIFQLLFSPRFGITDLLGDNLVRIQREQIRRYKSLNIYRQHEDFYMEYPERLREKDGLPTEEYGVFASLWNSISPYDIPSTNYAILGDLEFNLGNLSIKFRLTTELILHLGNFFIVSWYNVVEKQYESAAKDVFEGTTEEACIKFWELPHVNAQELFE